MINLCLNDVALSTAQKQDFGLCNTSLSWFHMSLTWGALNDGEVQAHSPEILGQLL